MQRPWQGQIEATEPERLPGHDPKCYLCPGNARANDNRNPDYTGPFVFDNDFPALTSASDVQAGQDALFRTRPESGRCRVICYTEQHDLRLATMSIDSICNALDAMIDEFRKLDREPDVGFVQLFENRGAMMGCSNAHPHAQVWATQHLPTEPAKELQGQIDYFEEHGRPLLEDYLQAELEHSERLVVDGDHFVALVPYWAVWPYEVLLLPRRTVAAPDELDADEIRGLAVVLRAVLGGYDTMFATSAPYSLGIHARPSDGRPHPEWQLHVHIYPPLLRSASVRKHLVGFEMLGMPQRDLTPEVAAAALRDTIDGKGS